MTEKKPRNRREQRLARERMRETGQSYTAALRDVRAEYEAMLVEENGDLNDE